MPERFFVYVTFLTGVGSGVVAGVFLAFSTFVMKALARLPAAQGIVAMQSINIAVIEPIFMSILFGSAVGCVVIAIRAGTHWPQPGAALRMAAAVIYLVGVIGVTIAFNVPRNNALAVLDPTSAEAAGFWSNYVSTWTAWNHVRTVSSLLAAVGLTIALFAFRNAE